MFTSLANPNRRWLRKAAIAAGVLVLVWIALLIPDSDVAVSSSALVPSRRVPFVWDQDSTWYALEERFADAHRSGCAGHRMALEHSLNRVQSMIANVPIGERVSTDPLFAAIEQELFAIAPLVAGCPDLFGAYLAESTRLRDVVKDRSVAWQMDDPETRRTMYRLLYGGRAALEEVMLQLPPQDVPALIRGREESSDTPFAEILGVRVHSGDILVSRGGAPTSALIARGNDFPGNFSHVALVHVDPLTRDVRIIESHIEKGVVISSIDDYLRDKKLRVMVMRLRHDHPAVLADPMVAHRAAQHALDDVNARHIPYDFEMRYDDPSKLFCSEVASAAYHAVGVRLWKGLSTISTPGLRTWLGAFGVRYFETQEPSDLEYDPQISVVAEWRDPETLYQDHLDNAVTEAMLEGAERGDPLSYERSILPLARLTKAYSVVLNWFGREGPIPEGMSATAGLRNQWYSDRHAAARGILNTKADAFRTAKGYRPPYWRLLEMARTSLAELPS